MTPVVNDEFPALECTSAPNSNICAAVGSNWRERNTPAATAVSFRSPPTRCNIHEADADERTPLAADDYSHMTRDHPAAVFKVNPAGME